MNGGQFIKIMTDKKFNTGLIIGKFYPFHLGHQYLIKTALQQVKKLTIIICQTNRYLIPVETRVSWIKEIFPDIEIRIICHESRLDSTSTDISKEWAKKVFNFLGFSPDVVFSSENYGCHFTKYLGSQHVLVDLNRSNFPVSGTFIRSNPMKFWIFLTDPVKEFYAQRIVILGAESTGTTTLAKDLAKYYATIWVPEYGRTYYEAKMYSPQKSLWNSDEFIHIATTQNQIENHYSRLCNGLLICDTDSWATRIWHHRYLNSWCHQLDTLSNYNKSLYILTDIDIPFVQDGTRDGQHIRYAMHQLFIKELQKHHKNYIVVSGSKKSRLKQAIKAIDIINQNGK